MDGRTRRQFCLGLASAVVVGGCVGGDGDHEHDDPPWEWGGLYDLNAATYTYRFQEGPDPEMRFAVLPTDEGDEHGFFHAGETATELFEGTGTRVTEGDTVEPSSETLYRVEFAESGETTITLDSAADGYYSVFTAHVPAEFDAELRSEQGAEITPEMTERHASHGHDDETNDGHHHDNETDDSGY